MATTDPPPQMFGQGNDPAADLQRQAAAAAARQGAQQAASRAQSGISEIKAYITENPASVKVACFTIGLILIVFSILGCFNLFDAAFEPKEYLNNLYNVFFGVIICICDGRESWMKACFNVQEKLFMYAYFLASQTGRAFFYFYVGSMTVLVLPDSWFWKVVYVCIGGVLCLLALLMLFLDWCGPFCGCKDATSSYGQMGSGTGNAP